MFGNIAALKFSIKISMTKKYKDKMPDNGFFSHFLIPGQGGGRGKIGELDFGHITN